ncbi:MAG: PIG-L family deacetylase, partial [Chloroflexi bacterium]|nr:PIG-L family deacetylase [Chloroflexota bacterium]
VFPSAGTRLIFTDLLKAGYEPHNVKKLYIHGADKPDTWVDISDTIDIKVKALQQHASQVPVDEVEKWMKDWAKEDAKDKEFEYAESYRVMKISEEKSEQ